MSCTASRIALVATLVTGVVAADAAAQRPDIARQIEENRRRLEEIRRERGQLQSQLERLRGQLHSLNGELENIERQKSVTSRIVNELDRQIATLNAQLDTVSLDLVLAQDALAEKRAVLQKRLVEIYKRGPLWIFEVLLAAESFGDLLSRYKYLYLVSRQDRALVGEVQELRDRVAAQRHQLLSIRSELERRRDERGVELGRYVALERQRQRAIRRTAATQRAATNRLDSLARDEERLSAIIASLEEARRRALAAGREVPGTATIGESDLGRLEWPVEGDVVYRFGPGRGPDNTRIRRHGIGIGVPVGTPVRAVAGGSVEHAGLMGTYGPTVLLNHGGGFYTLYLYLSRLSVRYGSYVNAGEIIGFSGGQTSDAGPHVEFQIRGEGGIALDPEVWLKPRR